MIIDNIIEKSHILIKSIGNDFRKILYFETDRKDILPGQFFMLNYYGCQKPFSASYFHSGILAFLIENRGGCSGKMLNASNGDFFGITGPLGTSFKTDDYKNFLLIGGGVGIAPVLFLAFYLNQSGKRFKLIIGERTKENMIYDGLLEDLYKLESQDILIYTNDGTSGEKGFATRDIEAILKEDKFDTACICGPEIMMKIAIERIRDRIGEMDIQVCMERYMKCGLGLCGSCVLDDIGLRVCNEGPVFTLDILNKSGEFGNYHRNGNGIIERI